MFRERRESAQGAGEGLRHRGNGRASGAGVQEQSRRWGLGHEKHGREISMKIDSG